MLHIGLLIVELIRILAIYQVRIFMQGGKAMAMLVQVVMNCVTRMKVVVMMDLEMVTQGLFVQ